MATKKTTAAAAAVRVHEGIDEGLVELMIPIELIDESPSQPRQHFDEASLEELADNLRAHGQLQPALVRPTGTNGRYELVFGARRLRAARLAGFPVLRCNVREDLDAKGALELQIVENAQRVDVHPLEEAEAYQRLRDEYGLRVDQVADRVGKTRAWVYARLKLCALTTVPREAFLAGKLDASRALLIARMPETFQAEACRDLVAEDSATAPGCESDPMSYREAQRHLRSRYMLKLADASFDVKDASLLPGAVPCWSCPKRTGNEMDLFGDVGDADVCTDPACYGAKREAAWQRQCQPLTAAGKATALPVAACDVLFESWAPNRMVYGAPYVDLEGSEWVGQKSVPWREILGGVGGKKLPPIILVQDREGHVHECVDRKKAMAALKRARAEAEGESKGGAGGNGKGKGTSAGENGGANVTGGAASTGQQSPGLDRALANAMTSRFIEAVVAAAAKGKPGDEFWRWLVLRELSMGDPPVGRVAVRRGLIEVDEARDKRGYSPEAFEAVEAAAKTLRGPALFGLLVELMATPDEYSYRPDNTWVVQSCELWGVDRKVLGGEVRKEMKAAAKEEKAKAAAKEEKAKTTAKSTREVRS